MATDPSAAAADSARPVYSRRGALLAGAGVVAASAAAVVCRRRDGVRLGPGPTAWKEIFFDDFSAGALDPAAWSRYDGPGGAGIGRRDPRRVVVGDGELRIVASGSVSGGLAHRLNLVHGRWDVRMRMDAGHGYGPAVLLWPQSDRWPDDGEIDIAEMPQGDRARSHFIVHWGTDNRQRGVTTDADFTEWHEFSCEWTADSIRYLLDAEPRWELRSPRAAIPVVPMHLAIQLDVGAEGFWIPAPDETTPQPVVLHVDWVRVSRPV